LKTTTVFLVLQAALAQCAEASINICPPILEALGGVANGMREHLCSSRGGGVAGASLLSESVLAGLVLSLGAPRSRQAWRICQNRSISWALNVLKDELTNENMLMENWCLSGNDVFFLSTYGTHTGAFLSFSESCQQGPFIICAP
jgi:hypothetical protein